MLKLGYVAAEVRESLWPGDPAIDSEKVSTAASEAFAEDGDASHLLPYVRAGAKPTRITFRSLSSDEAAMLTGLAVETNLFRAWEMAGRLAVDFPDLGDGVGDGRKLELWKGYRVLSDGFVRSLKREYPGMLSFYGRIVMTAATATEAEKKASSPLPTPPKSDGATEPAASESAPAGA